MSERKRVLVEAWSEFYRFLALNLSDWNSVLQIHCTRLYCYQWALCEEYYESLGAPKAGI